MESYQYHIANSEPEIIFDLNDISSYDIILNTTYYKLIKLIFSFYDIISDDIRVFVSHPIFVLTKGVVLTCLPQIYSNQSCPRFIQTRAATTL